MLEDMWEKGSWKGNKWIERGRDKTIKQLEKEIKILYKMDSELAVIHSDELMDAEHNALKAAANVLEMRLAIAKGEMEQDDYLIRARVFGLEANSILTRIKHIDSDKIMDSEAEYLGERKNEIWTFYEQEEGEKKELLLKQYDAMADNTSILGTRIKKIREGA